MFYILLISFPVQSFVITNLIKGLTVFNFFSILLLLKETFFIFYKKNKNLLKSFSIALAVYFAYFIVAQFGILIFNDRISQDIILISNESLNQFSFRKSFFTQSLYLIIVIFFYLKMLVFLRENGKEKVINIAFFTMWIFIIYGYFEFFMYLFTGNNADYISNRIAGEDFQVGLFQTITLAGKSIQRMKSLSGEPSMYAYTLLPFFILSIYTKRKLFTVVSFVTLLLTTSTSAVLGLLIYFIFDLIYRKNRLFKIFIFGILFLILGFIFSDIIFSMYTMVEVKLSLGNESGFVRFSNIINHFEAWNNANLINWIFGYGFGYVRSTEGLTTLLFNIGLLGTFLYCMFFILPYFMIKNKNTYIVGLFIANFVLLIIILISVSEFYYPHIWIFNALLWFEYLKEKQGKIKYGNN